MEKIKFALVGCGSIGKRHAAVIDAEPEAQLVVKHDQGSMHDEYVSVIASGSISFTNVWTRRISSAILYHGAMICIGFPREQYAFLSQILQATLNGTFH
ncbi:MAG: hypothetical protein SF053_13120 [Bacteroidia bacterium]|nr:hypothetical protein [Bacteroidia bacterium]